MTLFGRALRMDESDERIFARAAAEGEWAIPGGFEFSNFEEADLTGKVRQAFTNGWLGLDSFGRVTLVHVAPITDDELAALETRLAAHFVSHYGAPDLEAARPAAQEQIADMINLCTDHDPGSLLMVSRSLGAEGVRESFRARPPEPAMLEQIAKHVE